MLAETGGNPREAPGELTLLLRDFPIGDDAAASRLMTLIYPELKKLARARMRAERSGHKLQPTALVHEAYLRLVGHDHHAWQSRAHFYAAAANIMRRILVDYARSRHALKRSTDGGRVVTDLTDQAMSLGSVELLDLDTALIELEARSKRQARVVELRFFAGLTVPEVARALAITTRSVDRDWSAARAFLRTRLAL